MFKNYKMIINSILIIIIILCSFNILNSYYHYYLDRHTYSKIQKLKPVVFNSSSTEKNNETEKVKSDAKENNKKDVNEKELKSVNNEYKFWISIPNTNIEYPVVETKDNDFYLHNNFLKEKSSSGAIFIDYRNNIDTDRNIVVYGHNMKDLTMFNNITKFKNKEDFMSGNIHIIIDGKEKVYSIFSVFVANENDINLKTQFSTEDEYKKYVEELKKRSAYKKNIDSNYNKLITLYTCSYEFQDARTIVCAALNDSKE